MYFPSLCTINIFTVANSWCIYHHLATSTYLLLQSPGVFTFSLQHQHIYCCKILVYLPSFCNINIFTIAKSWCIYHHFTISTYLLSQGSYCIFEHFFCYLMAFTFHAKTTQLPKVLFKCSLNSPRIPWVSVAVLRLTSGLLLSGLSWYSQ